MDIDINLIDLSSLKLTNIITEKKTIIPLDIDVSKIDMPIMFKRIDTRPPCMNTNIDESNLIEMQCDSNLQRLCKDVRCKRCYNRSFASYPMSKYWSSKKAYFNCKSCYHDFCAVVYSISSGQWCPYCAIPSRVLCENNNCIECFNRSFSSHPSIKYWEDDADPRKIFKCSGKKFKFKCPKCSDVLMLKPIDVVSSGLRCKCSPCSNMTVRKPNSVIDEGSKCKYYSKSSLCDDNNCVECFNKSFESSDKARYWSKSNVLIPRKVFKKVSTKYNFVCDICSHEFSMTLCNISNGQWCPHCNHNKLCRRKECKYCWNKSFADHPKSKYLVDKNIETWCINLCSSESHLFKCEDCKHEFYKKVQYVSTGKWCSFCSHQELCKDEKCQFCFNNSFASHPDAYKWSTLNKFTSREVFKQANSKYYLYCEKCNHTYLKFLNDSMGCPYCCHQYLCGDNNCKYCFNNSFSSSDKAKYWSLKNKETAREVGIQSNYKYLFFCDKCNHEFLKEPSTIFAGQWCPYCSINCNMLCDDLNCRYCFDRSFASHSQVKHWSIKNKSNPRFVAKHSNLVFIFNCIYCSKEFERSANAMSSNSGCKDCLNKTEALLGNYLKLYFSFVPQAKFEWCINNKTGNIMIYDFYIPDYKILLELDGDQHFMLVKIFGNDVKENRYRDVHKMYLALKNGYSIIRVSQVDVWNNRINLDQELLPHIKLYKDSSVMYISTDSRLYDNHKIDLEKLLAGN